MFLLFIGNVINLDNSYEIISYFLYTWSRHLNADFLLGNYGVVKSTKNTDLDKYEYSGYGIDLTHDHNFHWQTVSGLK